MKFRIDFRSAHSRRGEALRVGVAQMVLFGILILLGTSVGTAAVVMAVVIVASYSTLGLIWYFRRGGGR